MMPQNPLGEAGQANTESLLVRSVATAGGTEGITTHVHLVDNGSSLVMGIQEHPSFEVLPPEIRSHILLHIGDLRTLRSLVRASPTYHAQYRLDRDIILGICLGREIDGLGPDAYALFRSSVDVLGEWRSNEDIIRFLQDYRDRLAPTVAVGVNLTLRPSYCGGLHLFICLLRCRSRNTSADRHLKT